MKQKESVQHPVKPAKIKALVRKALRQGFKCKPAKGYKFLKDLNPGDRWITSTGTVGILIEINSNAKVIIQNVPSIKDSIWTKCERQGFLGTKTIASTTEVKEIGNVKDGLDTLSSK